MNRTRLALLAIAAACGLGIARADEPAFNIIESRQAGQDLFASTFTGMLEGTKHQVPVKNFTNSAAAMARWMKQWSTLFPPGSDLGHPTRALPTVWSDRAEFDTTAATMVEATEKLSQLAKAEDTAGFTAQLKTVGDTCTACHNKFRAK
ncbi:MAG TPA: cytochrome c [Acetobacteraceae bacterium]|nr:cytochrome c [Acetobacteraceae bacterium]